VAAVGEHAVTTLEQLNELYGQVNPNSLAKERSALTPQYRALLEAAPFFALATCGPEGLDCSPRGDGHHVLAVLDDRTIAIPDRRGNNRLDSLRNIVRDERVALLFLIPGVSETLRINGRAYLSTDPDLIGRFVIDDKAPRSVIVVNIDSVYFQCARAVVRARLWDVDAHVDRSTLPSAGEMTKAVSPDFDALTYDAELPGRQAATLY
jgi:uncharacterized protein